LSTEGIPLSGVVGDQLASNGAAIAEGQEVAGRAFGDDPEIDGIRAEHVVIGFASALERHAVLSFCLETIALDLIPKVQAQNNIAPAAAAALAALDTHRSNSLYSSKTFCFIKT